MVYGRTTRVYIQRIVRLKHYLNRSYNRLHRIWSGEKFHASLSVKQTNHRRKQLVENNKFRVMSCSELCTFSRKHFVILLSAQCTYTKSTPL